MVHPCAAEWGRIAEKEGQERVMNPEDSDAVWNDISECIPKGFSEVVQLCPEKIAISLR